MKKLALVLVLVFALAIPALANPFVDVPLNHWAYDAVQTLAAKGVIVGYPDGTFGGQRTLTRYEMAEALAKALAYAEMNETLAEDVEILSKLSVEFADELASLGVSVADLEAAVGANSEAIAAMKELTDKHEKFFEPLTISGSIEANYEKVVFPTPLPAELTDTVELTFEVEINDTTTAGITLEADDILMAGGAIAPVVDDWWLKHFGEDLSLWLGEVEPATIGLGLIYDFDTNEEFYGAWAQWMWDTDEDLGTWTMFMDTADFYLLNIAFELGDDDDVPGSVTVSYDPTALGLIAGAELSFNLTDEDDEDDIGLALEAGVFTDLTTTAFGVAAQLSATFGDEDDFDATADVWFLQPGFAPSNSDYNADELGVELGVTFDITDEDDEDDIQVAANPYWGYTMDAAMVAATDHYVGLELTFANIDCDNPDCGGSLEVEYSILTGAVLFEGELLNLVLAEDDDGVDELVMNVHGEYELGTPTTYNAVANLVYFFEDEPMKLIVEGRLDSDGAAFYSAEAQLVYNLAENTDLQFGVEMNDWADDINDWDDNEILDTNTKVYAGVEVSF